MNEFNKYKKYVGISVVIILVIILISLITYSTVLNNFLDGLWVCDEDFCAESGINQMMFYMGHGSLLCKRNS